MIGIFDFLKKLFSKSKEENGKVEENFVHYNPWIGECYNEAKPKILALGESHYCASPDDDKTDLTQSVIDDFINPNSAFEPYKNTYTKFTRALAGCKVPKNELKDIWNYVMFYNYVQFPMSGPRQSPTSEQFTISEKAFRQVVNQYKPDVVIAWGYRLFKYLPEGEDYYIHVLGFPIKIRGYNIQNHKFLAMQMMHPSAGYDWMFWHKAIEKVLESCI